MVMFIEERQQVSIRPPVNRDFDNMPIFDNYREISRAAAKKIKENDIVYLTGGSWRNVGSNSRWKCIGWRNSASMCNQGIKGGDRISTDLVVGREVSNRTQSIYMEFLCVTDWDKVKISL